MIKGFYFHYDYLQLLASVHLRSLHAKLFDLSFSGL